MVTFANFSNLLPDPDNKISDAGSVDNTTGSAGPGFARIKFKSSNDDVQKSKTRSGRGLGVSSASHSWEFDIDYNPLTREEFEPVSTFLEQKGGYIPFYVILPQYNKPRDSTFNTYLLTDTVTTGSSNNAGLSKMVITGSGGGITGDPKPGDFFTITDAADVNHTKSYKVTRVETPSLFQTGFPVSVGQRRIHFHPPLARSVASGATINFINPQFRVRQKAEIVEYDLNTEGLYQFSLSLEEVQP